MEQGTNPRDELAAALAAALHAAIDAREFGVAERLLAIVRECEAGSGR